MDLSLEQRSADLPMVAGYREHDMVQFRRPITSLGRIWPAGTAGAIVFLGDADKGCIVEVDESREGLVDASYADLEPWAGQA